MKIRKLYDQEGFPVHRTIKEYDYPEYFIYYKDLIKEMDDEFGSWMNTSWSNPIFFHNNWEEIKSSMLNVIHNSLKEIGERNEK
jgi:hypothetical protein|tara:strand:- start:180 stop:431 length:252 start_codon:yes stop_codon:yes gene_type:complete